ncbi:MAG TPA: hypothetical protein VGF91_13850 [Solirubrobacteraceae bacterium]|jgi:hypothetical protein
MTEQSTATRKRAWSVEAFERFRANPDPARVRTRDGLVAANRVVFDTAEFKARSGKTSPGRRGPGCEVSTTTPASRLTARAGGGRRRAADARTSIATDIGTMSARANDFKRRSFAPPPDTTLRRAAYLSHGNAFARF